MITPLLKTTLEPVVSRHRRVRLMRELVVVLVIFAAIAVALRAFEVLLFPATLLVLLSLIVAWMIVRRAYAWEPDYRAIARRIEQQHPGLHAVLLTAIEQQPDPATRSLSFLQQKVVADAIGQARQQTWIESVPKWSLAGHTVMVALALGAFLWAALGMADQQRQQRHSATRPAKSKGDSVEISPGDATIERGTGIVVLATFHRDVPSEATLVVQPQNEATFRVPLVKNLDDPVFGGGLPEVKGDLTYRVEYAGKASRDFSVRVFEHPRLERADATLRYPAYTALGEKMLPDTRRVSAVEGTKLEVAFHLNKSVKTASLVGKKGTIIPLVLEPGEPTASLRDFSVAASETYEVRLEDADGRTSKVPAQFAIDAVSNRKPELKLATPRGDQRVSPIEEIAFRAEAWDDFGMARYGLAIAVRGAQLEEIELGRSTSADERQKRDHVLKLESVGVKPDELVSWYLWAEDTGPDGKPRRTASDMFFAEVRPFEEIYRPGDGSDGEQEQQQGGGGGGQSEQATQLAEMQKQIISATWNLQRAEEGRVKPSEKYLKDEPVVRDSQAEALGKATALGEGVEDPKSRALIENVETEMKKALSKLEEATTTTAPLPDAVAAEQSAYNALLKLAAHEFRVSRRQQRGGAQQGQARQQAQLNELEMKEEQKRYETKREAQPMQNEQQQEQLAVLNRLKELAQRQNDVNERLNELQSALQAAKTEEEKEEVRRQLKRLREEEQQLLADMDDLRQKMDESTEQSQFAEERKQLEQTRGEAQQAAEAMERNAAAQALASGTRAAKNLEAMRDELRKKTSEQFKEAMREMRSDARELAQAQQEIAEKLEQSPEKPGRRTLDGSGEREQLSEQLEKQQGKLGGITEEMKRVSEQAEAAEPLLARELYETVRKTAQADTNSTLEMAQQLAMRGYSTQAQQFEEKARGEIEELKSGVERAAESVLGDEAEALRQARAELESLNEQLEREMAQARPDLARAAGQEGPRSGEQREGDGQSGGAEPREGEPNAQQGGREAGAETDASANPPVAEAEGRGAGERSAETRQANASGDSPDGQTEDQEDRKEQQAGGARRQTAQNEEGQPREGAQGEDPQAQQPGRNAERGEGQQEQQGERGGRNGQTPQTAQNGSSQQPGDQAGAQGGQPGDGSRPSQSAQGGADGQRSQSRLANLTNSGGLRSGREEGGGGGGEEVRQAGPLTGENFSEWSDRLRNVEEMLDDPALRQEAARVREIARGVRVDFKRHSVKPNWDLVQTEIRQPLAELRSRVNEELARREAKENLVPIDRDPVPTQYAERVKRYYEELGRSR